MVRKLLYFKTCLVIVLLLSSCNAKKKIAYLQDMPNDSTVQIVKNYEVRIQPDDMLGITVSSKDSELITLFENSAETINKTGAVSNNNSGYLVDAQGYINFPVLGMIEAAGLTRAELGQKIQQKLIKDGYVNDPVVSVKILNFKVSVMGEVKKPGTYNIISDRLTIFEALSMAGDLDIQGQRDRVLVVREEDGQRRMFYTDLRTKKIFDSPAYYLQQNDVIYVEPNNRKSIRANDNQFMNMSAWASLMSVLVSLSILIFRR
ncbi:polysaccharide biosynthesis/export family protein [Coprobacter tertius]|uniref:Polysaccharide export protein n=1 Tax=Coprobacter tertius TaxID=2944915 RepID=A0ABT1MIF0_9BACT|nr:polysaccharide biosynthesis/export family protein [Coprobacter tertius]MCP9611468.1 polysaccharide export protein [Coprobacter tertius]